MRRLIAALVAIILAGCAGTLVSETFDEVGTSLPVPATGGDAGDEPTIEMILGASAGGPGISIEQALATAGGEPPLVNGVLLMDAEGTIWLCDSVDEDASPPVCEEPRLRVLNYPEGTADWDLSSAEVTGLQERDGILWIEGSQIYGEVRP